MNAYDAILTAASIVLAVPILLIALQTCVAALFKNHNDPAPAPISSRCSIAVIIPAHNEAPVIAQTIVTILPHLQSTDSLLVIADNCTDNTAAIAKNAGAMVTLRNDPSHHGKGYALAAGIDFLRQNPPEVVVMIDADTKIEPHSLTALVTHASFYNQPCQSINLLNLPFAPRPHSHISAFAFLFKNLVRARGAHALGMPCLLRGTGMAFPWSIIRSVNLSTSNIVEDMQFGVDMAIACHSPRLCLATIVTGTLPQSSSAQTSQRTRWEHGHLFTILSCAPRLVWNAVKLCRPALLALALDLSVPPLALLVLIWAAMTVLASASYALNLSGPEPIILLLSAGSLLLATILLAWLRFARHLLPLSMLLSFPFYILQKIPLYLAFIFRRQKVWIRTERIS
jgi:cellulose synthase/poly-beta-1,6-N-acetylglucosamine synthase-like glycosyltransferase